jgi:hypothetical protein
MTISRNISKLAPGTSTVGVLAPTKGGTGQTTLTANNVILGNGTDPVQFVAPGTSGSVLTSNGVTWTSLLTGLPLVFSDISNQADGVKCVFALLTDQTAVTGIVDNKDLQVVVNGRIISPYVTERTYPWINISISKGFAVVTTGTTANQLVIYNAPDVGSQISVTQLSISASKQNRSYPYSATTIALGG